MINQHINKHSYHQSPPDEGCCRNASCALN